MDTSGAQLGKCLTLHKPCSLYLLGRRRACMFLRADVVRNGDHGGSQFCNPVFGNGLSLYFASSITRVVFLMSMQHDEDKFGERWKFKMRQVFD